MRSLISFAIFLAFSGFVLPERSYSSDSYSERYSIPDSLYDQLDQIGFNENELEEIAVDGSVLSIKFDSEKLNTKRAYKIISVICDYTRNNPAEWQGLEFATIEIMDFLQSNRLIFFGGIKGCLRLPAHPNDEQIKPYTEIKRGY